LFPLTLPTIVVPDLTQVAFADMPALVGYDLEIVITESAYSEVVAAGGVVGQTPAAGESLRRGERISLVVSSGPEPRSLPLDAVGRTLADVTAQLVGLGLVVNPIPEYNEEIVSDVVLGISPDPAAGPVPKGSTVDVRYSAGKAPRVIPATAGQDPAAAEAQLVGLGFTVVRSEAFSDDIAAGLTVGTSPGAGVEHPFGSEVGLLISKGPDTVTVPNVVGLSPAKARSTLEGAGLRVGSTFGPSDASKVIYVIPGVGATLKRGSAVNLYVS
jgi:serine/threonine-protein kinase